MHVPVRLEELLFEVRLSPVSPPWLPDAIQATMEKFGYQIPVQISQLNRLTYLP